MSGGHYDYQDFKIKEVTEAVSGDLSGPPEPDREWLPKDQTLADLVRKVGELLFGICHDVDYHICGDTVIRDMDAYRMEQIAKLEAIAEKAARAHRKLAFEKAIAEEGY